MPPKVLIIDVDGVMTDGSFQYTTAGKAVKVFSADDNDALKLITPHLEVRFVSGDHRGFPISRKRIAEDMRQPLDLVSTTERVEWIAERYALADVAYMGDGIFDARVFSQVGYAIAVANALPQTRKHAHYVTQRRGGDRAVAEAILHLLERFFQPFDPTARAALPPRPAKRPAAADPLATAQAYFEAFNARDFERFAATLAPEVTLVDWENAAQGREAVVAANQAIVAAVPSLRVKVQACHRADGVVAAEIAIIAESFAPFTVTDILEFDERGRITSIRAYRGAAYSGDEPAGQAGAP